MDPLRITLIIIAILVIAAIVVNHQLSRARNGMGKRTKKRSQPKETLTPPANNDFLDEFEIIPKRKEPVFTDVDETETSVADSKSANNGKQEQNSASGPVVTEEPKTAPPLSQPTKLMLSLFIMAPQEMVFDGGHLRKIIETLGFEFGDMKIFHRVDQDKNLISIANIAEPGYFELEEMDNFTTPGVAMFSQLPATQPGPEVLEEMLDAAKRLAEHMKGTVCNSRGKPLTEEDLRQLRYQAEPFSAV